MLLSYCVKAQSQIDGTLTVKAKNAEDALINMTSWSPAVGDVNWQMFTDSWGRWGIRNPNNGVKSLVIEGQNVGIGTETPLARLHISSSIGGSIVKLQSSGGSTGLTFTSPTNNRDYQVFSDIAGNWGVYDGVAKLDRIIVGQNGNVGIGIDAIDQAPLPAYQLELGRDNATSTATQMFVHGHAKFNNSADHTNMTQVSINTNNLVTGAALTVAGPTYIGTWQSADVGVKADYLSKYHLWVERGVVSEDFAVAKAQQWRDEVFKEGYQLPTLNEIAQFVSEHKHLPGIPSEEEVKDKGYTVNQMTLAFLEKIEQLTLYAIDQEKKIKELEKQVAQYSS
ncbi:MAG: hypothetical protein J7497_16085, partial [Chitinophagaceae bacterium]|nr:hypothetical protein [Chitinophagaceae bacterium]